MPLLPILRQIEKLLVAGGGKIDVLFLVDDPLSACHYIADSLSLIELHGIADDVLSETLQRIKMDFRDTALIVVSADSTHRIMFTVTGRAQLSTVTSQGLEDGGYVGDSKYDATFVEITARTSDSLQTLV